MNRRMSRDVSLNAPMNQENDSAEWQDTLVEEGSEQETSLAESEESETRRRALGVALNVLDDRERHIFQARRLNDPPLTLDELAGELRISRERVRHIETSAFKNVQRAARAVCALRRRHHDRFGGIHAVQ